MSFRKKLIQIGSAVLTQALVFSGPAASVLSGSGLPGKAWINAVSEGMNAGVMTAYADDIVQEDTGSGADASDSADGTDSGSLIEDDGQSSSDNTGVPMGVLQEAIDSGDEEALKSFEDGTALSGEDQRQPDPEQETAQAVQEAALEAADPKRIRQRMNELSEYDSVTGSDDELRAADYISQKMESFGYTVQTQPFHEGFVDETGNDEQGVNIIAERGADSQENRTGDIFLVTTHYDLQRDSRQDDPFAYDRTGVFVLLEAGRILAQEETAVDLCFVFLSGEEDGLCGSEQFIKSLDDEEKSRITGCLDVERVGYAPASFYVLETLDGQGNAAAGAVREAGLLADRERAVENSSASQTKTAQDGTLQDGISPEDDESSSEGLSSAPALAASNLSGTSGAEHNKAAAGADMAGTENETETETEDGSAKVLPAKWGVVRDDTLTHTSFEKASIPSATLTQFFPGMRQNGLKPEETEEEAGGETNAPTLDRTSGEKITDDAGNRTTDAGTGDQTESAEESAEESADSVPAADAEELAYITDIVAEALWSVMNPYA